MKIIEVIWLDAQSSTEYVNIEYFNSYEPIYTSSIGYLLFENSDYLILVFMICDNNKYKHWQLIPKLLIKEIKKIKVKK